nr:hypothetical protein [Tanacetum cinerariifolium]
LVPGFLMPPTVIEDLSTRMGNLEYRHGQLVKKAVYRLEQVSAQVEQGQQTTTHRDETVDGRVIYMFVDVSYPLSEATLEHMLRHGLKVPKLLVGGDLTMAEQLVRFIKAVLLNAQSAV